MNECLMLTGPKMTSNSEASTKYTSIRTYEPTVYFPVFTGTKLYCLVTEARKCAHTQNINSSLGTGEGIIEEIIHHLLLYKIFPHFKGM